MKNRVPPQAQDVEKAVLGAILLEKDAMNVVSELLKPEMFYSAANQTVFSSMLSLNSKSSPIDFLTLKDDLGSKKQLDLIGGPYYLTTLTNEVVSSAHTLNHCRKIIEKHLLRSLIKMGGELYTKGFDEQSDPFELIEFASKQLHELTMSINSKDYFSIDSTLVDIMKDLEEKRNRTAHLTGPTTGYRELDKSTCGWQASDLIILAARPKCGKTAMALNLSLNASLSGTGVGFFSMEMSAPQLVKRILSNKSSIYLQSLRDARLDDEQMANLYHHGVQKVAGIPFYIDDTAALSIPEFKAKARRMVNKSGVGLIVLDYLQLMQGDKGKRNMNREQEISNIARQIKITAKELNVPIIALSQLSREVEKRGTHVPQLSDLRESGALEQDADMVCFLYKPTEVEVQTDASKVNTIYFKIAAYRNGEPRTFEFEFKGEFQRFSEIGGLVPVDLHLPYNPKQARAYEEDPF